GSGQHDGRNHPIEWHPHDGHLSRVLSGHEGETLGLLRRGETLGSPRCAAWPWLLTWRASCGNFARLRALIEQVLGVARRVIVSFVCHWWAAVVIRQNRRLDLSARGLATTSQGKQHAAEQNPSAHGILLRSESMKRPLVCAEL